MRLYRINNDPQGPLTFRALLKEILHNVNHLLWRGSILRLWPRVCPFDDLLLRLLHVISLAQKWISVCVEIVDGHTDCPPDTDNPIQIFAND